MSDTGSSGDNKPQQHEVNLVSSAAVPEVENKPVTPAKRTPSKRISAVERAQRESEELVKTLGGSLDIEGGRKTRSSTRGTPSRSNVVDTPPPTKKARNTSGTPRRGRGRKLETTVEDEVKTTEKIHSEPETIKEEEEESSTIEATKTDEKVGDTEPEANEIPPAAEEKQSPVKLEEKPEPMEVDGADKVENTTPAELEVVGESTQIKQVTEKIEENSKESEKVVVEQQEESSSVAEKDDPPTPVPTPVPTPAAPAPVEEAKNSMLENKLVENSIGNNIDINNSDGNAKSPPTPPPPPPPSTPAPATTPAPAPPVTVAGNDHKAESNEFCEPKIASPPITANNDGATPQYFYLKNL